MLVSLTEISPKLVASKTLNKFLHVGCGPKKKHQTTTGFNTNEWDEVRFDIDASVDPDVLGSMTDMSAVSDNSVHAIFSSHNIEHLHAHEVTMALAEFKRVLDDEGFVVITCPDLQSVAALIVEDKLLDAAYVSPAGPIAPLDILYGHRAAIAAGNFFMAHNCGFTQRVLASTFKQAGFESVASARRLSPFFDLWALASVNEKSASEMETIAKAHFPS